MATTVRITGDYNPTSSERSGTVTFTNSDGVTARVTVTQPVYTHTLTINLLTNVNGQARLSLTVDGSYYGSVLIYYGTPYVGKFAYGAVVRWSITASGYIEAIGEVTMTSDQTVNVSLPIRS